MTTSHLTRKRLRPLYLSLPLSILLLVSLLLPFPSQVSAQEGLESSELALSRGVLLYDENKFSEAIRQFLKALEGDPKNTTIIYYLGRSYIGQKNLDLAVDVLKKGLQVDPKNRDIRYQLGIVYFLQDSFEDALKHFLEVYEADPTEENIGYYIGLCYFRKKEFAKALPYLQKNVSTESVTRQLATYYTGLTLQALERGAEAAEELNEAILIEPTSPLVVGTQHLLRVLRVVRPAAKRFFLQATLNTQYDSNVRNNPKEDERIKLPRTGSMGNLIYLRGDFFLERSERWEHSVTYAFLQTINYRLHDQDIQNHRVQTNFTFKNLTGSGLPYFLGIQANYDFFLRGGAKFLQRPGATLSATLLENAANFTTAYYRFDYKDFFEKPFTSNEDRDAHRHTLGLIHYYRFGDSRHQIHGGYKFDYQDSQGRDYRYVGNKVLAGILIRLPWKVQWNTNFEYHWRTYCNRNSAFAESRQDEQRILLVSLSKEIARNLTVTLETLFDSNASKIQNFKTRKSLTSVGLTWRY